MRTEPAPAVLACGAWLKNAACLWAGGRAHWSPVHGDLGEPAACEALQASARALLAQAEAMGTPVRAIAHDLHPDFFSTRLAQMLAHERDLPAIGVQHHHAHIASVVAEHGLQGPVLGLALDGVGLGTDHQAWGGELLWLHGAHWQRLGHLRTLALPGGDRAAREPWRMAASALHALGRGDQIVPRFAPLVGEELAAGVRQMLDRGLNCPLTSSTGRWFDAASAALGLSLRQHDEAEAAIALERAAARALATTPGLAPLPGAQVVNGQLDLLEPLVALFDAPCDGIDAAAAGFHLALADALARWLIDAAHERGVPQAALGGGCFYNRVLRERVTRRLQDAGLAVYGAGAHGCGDAGLALGQAWVAAQQLDARIPHAIQQEALPCA